MRQNMGLPAVKGQNKAASGPRPEAVGFIVRDRVSSERDLAGRIKVSVKPKREPAGDRLHRGHNLQQSRWRCQTVLRPDRFTGLCGEWVKPSTRQSPHPGPPPEYRGRGQEDGECVTLAGRVFRPQGTRRNEMKAHVRRKVSAALAAAVGFAGIIAIAAESHEGPPQPWSKYKVHDM